MKKVFAVILAAVLVTLMSAGCFAEAGPEMPDGLFRHIIEMWTDEGGHWYQTYFAGLGPHSMSFPDQEPAGMCSVGFILDQERVQISQRTEDGTGVRYAWDGMTPATLIRLCAEMCRTWKDYKEIGTLRIVVVYEEKDILLTIRDEEAAQAFLKMPISEFKADRYEKEAEGLCGYILNDWLDGASAYYEAYFSKHDPYVRKDIMPLGDGLCGVIFVMDRGIIDLIGTDANGNGVEFEWNGFEGQDMLFMCAGMCMNWKEYAERGKLKILLTYEDRDASMMIRNEEEVQKFMDLFGGLFPEAKAIIEETAAE